MRAVGVASPSAAIVSESLALSMAAASEPVAHVAGAGAAVGGKVFFTPDRAPGILELDPSTSAVRLIDTEKLYSDDSKWYGAAAVGEKVVFAPRTAPGAWRPRGTRTA